MTETPAPLRWCTAALLQVRAHRVCCLPTLCRGALQLILPLISVLPRAPSMTNAHLF